MVTLAATVPVLTPEVKLEFRLSWISKPASLFELSVHLQVMVVFDPAFIAQIRLLGAAGRAPAAVTVKVAMAGRALLPLVVYSAPAGIVLVHMPV